MKKLALVPMHQIESLPKWSAPKNLGAAATKISELGRDMHEHAYLVGRTLSWVKKEVGHGKFDNWIKTNVWFGKRTAVRMMAFAQRCDEVGYTVEYHPGKSATMTHLPNKKRKQKKSEPSSWDKLLTEDPLMRHESELADFIRTAFDEWPVDQREHFFKTIQWVLDELR